MTQLILDVFLALSAFVVTAICGLPLVWSAKSRWMTRIALSFAAGYVLLSMAGIAGVLVGIDPLMIQAAVSLTCAVLYVAALANQRPSLSVVLDKDDWVVIISTVVYLLIVISFFDRITMWMAGDAVSHAEKIRMLIDGEMLPVSLPGLGSYWEYYPKGFYYYCYPLARAFTVLNVLQTVPVLITAATPVLLYSIARELRQETAAVYAFFLACLVFPAHYNYLIWAGYPSAAAEMILVSAVLAAVVEVRMVPILLLGVLLSHARVMVTTCGSLLGYIAAKRLDGKMALVGFVAIGGALILFIPIHRPEFLSNVFSSRSLSSEFIAIWYPAFLALFGAGIAIFRREKLDRLAIGWASAVALIVLLADIGPLSFVGTADRLLLVLYLPLSLFGAVALSRMDGGDRKVRFLFLLLLILVGSAAMGGIFYSYAESWRMPQEDYNAIMWLSGLNLSDAICINVDETGAWVYPLAGIPVAMPRGSKFALSEGIIKDPGDPAVLEGLRRIENQIVLIYVSSVSIMYPGLVPPFREYESTYPNVNMSFPSADYELIYNKGAKIYKLRNDPADILD